MKRFHLAVAFAAVMASCFVQAGQLVGKGELLAIRCDENPVKLVAWTGAHKLGNCVGVIELRNGPKAFALDKPYDDLVGIQVAIVNNGETHSLIGASK